MKQKRRYAIYIYLILFVGFAFFAVLAGVFSAPLYKNIYIQKHGMETMALITGCKYDHSAGDAGSRSDFYSFTYEFELDGTVYNGITTGQYRKRNIDSDSTTKSYIKIKYLSSGESCASDYAMANDLPAAIGSYIMAAIALVPLFFMIKDMVWRIQRRRVLSCGKDGKANFIRMDGGLQAFGKSYYRIIYDFEFSDSGYRRVKTPYQYEYNEVEALVKDGYIDIRYDHNGRSTIIDDSNKNVCEKNIDIGKTFGKYSTAHSLQITDISANQIKTADMPAVFKTELGDKTLTELYSKKSSAEIMEFLVNIKTSGLPQDLVDELVKEAVLCLSTMGIKGQGL